MKQRFRPEQRLHRPAEFAAVLAARRVLRGAVFDLHYLMPSGHAGPARLGLVVPKRLARRAVLRNAIKRQAREAFRSVAADVPAADIVLRLARPAGVTGRVGQGDGRGDGKGGWREEILALLRQLPVPKA